MTDDRSRVPRVQAQALVRDGLLKRRRGGWYEVVGGDISRTPEHAGRHVNEVLALEEADERKAKYLREGGFLLS